nr:hypothetical protein [Streptococcus oralis]
MQEAIEVLDFKLATQIRGVMLEVKVLD